MGVAGVLLFRPTQLKLDGILTCTYPNTTIVVYLFWCTKFSTTTTAAVQFFKC